MMDMVRIPAGVEALVGERVRLVHTDDEFTSLVAGDQGVVTRVAPDWISPGGGWVIDIDWDSGSRLSMVTASGDTVEVVS